MTQSLSNFKKMFMLDLRALNCVVYHHMAEMIKVIRGDDEKGKFIKETLTLVV